MRRLFVVICLLLTVTGCASQDLRVGPPSVGLVTGTVTQVANGTVTIATSNGPHLELSGELEKGVEYDMVYEITERGTVLIKGILIAAEHSSNENRKRRAKLVEIKAARNN